MAVSLRASKQGLKIVDRARKKKNWNATAAAWVDAAQTSTSTLKRFRRGLRIQKDAFIGICEAVGVNWKDVVDNSVNSGNVINNRLVIEFNSTVEELSEVQQGIVKTLQEKVPGLQFKIVGSYEGSVLLILEGSKQFTKKIEALFKAGELTEIMGIPVDDVWLDLEEIEAIINVRQWLQNNFAQTIETGWLTLEEIFGTKRPAFRSQAVKRAKQIQLGDIAINLLVELDPQPNQEINLFLGIYPATESARLPDNLQIEIVMENGEVLTTYSTENDEEAVAWDDFVFEPGEQFALEISLGDLSNREVFQL